MTLNIRENEPLARYTTLKIGGTARYFVVVVSIDELKEAVLFARKKALPLFVLGGGSNMLIADGEIDALVIKMEIQGVKWIFPGFSIFNFQFSKSKDRVAVVGAGESWDAFVAETVEKGLWGLENLSGIPGTVGASPVQNIGAYGVEVKDSILWVEVFDVRTGKLVKLSNEECGFSYRDSIFKQEKGRSLIVLNVAFALQKNGIPRLEYKDIKENFKLQIESVKQEKAVEQITIQEIRKAVLEIRAGKFPDLAVYGTAGSFFKNPIISQEKFDELKKKFPGLPGFKAHGTGENETNTKPPRKVKVPLAWILDHICGMKGYSKGNVALFERQPIVVVNTGHATAEEITAFTNSVMRCVKEKTGIDVDCEVQKI